MKKKTVTGIIICIAAALVCAAAAAFALFGGTGSVSVPGGRTEDGGAAPGNSECVAALLSSAGAQAKLPSDMSGVWFDLNTEISSTGTDAQTLYNEITEDFAYFRNFQTNALFIQPDVTGKTGGFVNYDGSAFDALGTVLSIASQNGIFSVFAADEAMMTENGQYTSAKIMKVLNSHQFDAVYLCSPSAAAAGALTPFVSAFKSELTAKYPGMYLGCEVYSLEFSSAKYKKELEAVSSGAVDFVVFNADCRTDTKPSFTSVASGWNNVAASLPGVSFYCIHRNDKVYSGSGGWTDYLEIVYQYKELWNLNRIKGSVYYKLREMKTRKASSQRLSSMIYDGATPDFEIRAMTLSPTEDTVNYSGVFDTDRAIFCNSETVKTKKNKFDVTYKLSPGTNDFHFENAGQYYNYAIFSNSPLIYAPSVSVQDGMLNVSVTCPAASSVYAVFAGQAYQMTQGEVNGVYAGYSAVLNSTVPGFSSADLDIVCVHGKDGRAETVGTVNFSDGSVVKSAAVNAKPTPYSDNGLGTAIMCEIKYDATEQLGILNSYDTYDPDKSTLIGGTLDYVNQINLTDDGNIRYELRSGVAVYAENCTLINNAFVMPKNNIAVTGTDDSSSTSTDIRFSYDWLSPVTVTTAPNDYKKGYQSFSFNVSSFSAEYADVTFGYTDSVINAEKLKFSADSPFSSAEVLPGANNESTVLRLHFKKPGGFYGFSMTVEPGNVLLISFKKHSGNSIAGKTVMLDPGHGGLSMTGTAVANQSICEASVTLSVAFKVQQLLKNMGANVVLTRYYDSSLTLSDRVKICEAQKPDAFISLHCDGAENKAEAGTHTFYYRPYSQPLAEAIHSRLVHNYTTYIYTDADTNRDIVNKQIKYYPFFVTRTDTCPSVLCEMGFMSNAVESSVLTDENCQYWLADAIANGIADYFGN